MVADSTELTSRTRLLMRAKRETCANSTLLPSLLLTSMYGIEASSDRLCITQTKLACIRILQLCLSNLCPFKCYNSAP